MATTAINTGAKTKKRKANNSSPPTSNTFTPEVVQTSQHQENLQVSHLGTQDQDEDAGSSNSSDVAVEEIEDGDENESALIECDFYSKNIYSVLNNQPSPSPTAANADGTKIDAPAFTYQTICKHCTSAHKEWDYKGEMRNTPAFPTGYCCWEKECNGPFSVNRDKM